MPVYQVTSFFRNTARCSGWTHSFYLDADTALNAIVQMSNVWTNLRGVWAANVECTHIRASRTDIIGDAFVRNPFDDLRGPLANLAQLETHEALLVHFYVSPTQKIPYILKGWADAAMQRNNVGDVRALEPAGAQFFFKFVDELKAHRFALRVLSPRTPQGGRIIQSIVYDDDEMGYRVTTQAATGIETGDEIFIGGPQAKDFPTLKGSQIALVEGPTVFLVRVEKSCRDKPYKGSLKVWRRQFTFPQITDGNPVRVVTRKSGRPFGLLAGRTSPRTCP